MTSVMERVLVLGLVMCGCVLLSASAFEHKVKEAIPTSSAMYLHSEGPMWSKSAAPYGTDSPFVDVHLRLTSQTDMEELTGKAWLLFLEGEHAVEQVGVEVPSPIGSSAGASVSYCCNPDVRDSGACTASQLDQPLLAPDHDPNSVTIVPFPAWGRITDPENRVRTQLEHKFEFGASGEKVVALMVCDYQNSSTADMTGTISYKNPYGYVPGLKYAYGPLYAALTIAYFLLMVIYLFAMVKNREFLLPLQTAVACVVVVGLLEVMAWVIVYWTKNKSGQPPCCPVSPDVLVAVVLKIVKQGVSRWLLLAVCLGFGVVQERLERGSLTFVTGLTIAYILLGLNVEIRYATSETLTRTSWEFPLFLVDLTFMLCIQASLTNIRRMLATSAQVVKLGMYNKLAATLAVFIVVWLACTILVAMVELDYLGVGWELLWIGFRFWDVLYFFLLFVIALLWRPSRQSFQYSNYSQPAPLDADEDVPGVEMRVTSGAAGFQIGDDSDSEVELELGGGGPIATRATTTTTTAAAASSSSFGHHMASSSTAAAAADGFSDDGFDDGSQGGDDDGEQFALEVADVDLRELQRPPRTHTD